MKCFYRLQLNHDKNNLRLRQSIYFKQIRAHICVNLLDFVAYFLKNALILFQ